MLSVGRRTPRMYSRQMADVFVSLASEDCDGIKPLANEPLVNRVFREAAKEAGARA